MAGGGHRRFYERPSKEKRPLKLKQHKENQWRMMKVVKRLLLASRPLVMLSFSATGCGTGSTDGVWV